MQETNATGQRIQSKYTKNKGVIIQTLPGCNPLFLIKWDDPRRFDSWLPTQDFRTIKD